jgi:hypothetical protein
MRMRTNAVITAAALVAASAFLAGCGPKKVAAPPPPTTLTTPTASPSPTAAAASPTVPALTPGNCTLYSKSDAVALLGAVNDTNKALNIGTDGGTKIDNCAYLDIKGAASVIGVSYAVVRYDSDATAFGEAQKVRTEMVGDAADHKWAVQPLSTPVPNAGPLLGGVGTKTEQGVTSTLAVVGTNVGPYLVVALGASTVNVDDAKRYALTLFQSLAVTAS